MMPSDAGEHVCTLGTRLLSAYRCCTPDRCTGEVTCRAPVHIHGCYADWGGADCTAPEEHEQARRGV